MANQEGVSEVLTVGQQLRQHPVGKLLVDQDHLVSRSSWSIDSRIGSPSCDIQLPAFTAQVHSD